MILQLQIEVEVESSRVGSKGAPNIALLFNVNFSTESEDRIGADVDIDFYILEINVEREISVSF